MSVVDLSAFIGRMNAFLGRLDHVPAEIRTAVDYQVLALKDSIQEKTPIQDPPEDDIVAEQSWRMSSSLVGPLSSWMIWNEAKNPRNDFPYPALCDSTHTLEYGWSDQAPEGMVRVSIEEHRAAFQAIGASVSI